MFGPMTGKLISEIVLGEEPSFDITELSLNRFKEKREFKIEKSVV